MLLLPEETVDSPRKFSTAFLSTMDSDDSLSITKEIDLGNIIESIESDIAQSDETKSIDYVENIGDSQSPANAGPDKTENCENLNVTAAVPDSVGSDSSNQSVGKDTADCTSEKTQVESDQVVNCERINDDCNEDVETTQSSEDVDSSKCADVPILAEETLSLNSILREDAKSDLESDPTSIPFSISDCQLPADVFTDAKCDVLMSNFDFNSIVEKGEEMKLQCTMEKNASLENIDIVENKNENSVENGLEIHSVHGPAKTQECSLSVETVVKENSNVVSTSLKNDAMVFIATDGMKFSQDNYDLQDSNALNSDLDKENIRSNDILNKINGEDKATNPVKKVNCLDDNTVQEISQVIDTLDLLLSDDESEPKEKDPENVKENKTVSAASDKISSIGEKADTPQTERGRSVEKMETECDSNTVLIEDDSQTSDKPIDSNDMPSETPSVVDNLSSIFSSKTDGSSSVNIDKKSINVLPLNFMNQFKSSLSQVTREDLEELCLVKIVESITKRSNLSEAEAKIKAQSKKIEILRKTLAVVTKQNRDLEIVMKALSAEHKKRRNEIVEPVRISRSVGFQVGPSTLRGKNNKGTNNSSASNAQTPAVKDPSPTVTTTATNSYNNKNAKLQNPTENAANIYTSYALDNRKKPPANQNNGLTITNKKNDKNKQLVSQMLKQQVTVTKNYVPQKTAEKRLADQSIDLTDDEPPQKQIAGVNRSRLIPVNVKHNTTSAEAIRDKIPKHIIVKQFINTGVSSPSMMPRNDNKPPDSCVPNIKFIPIKNNNNNNLSKISPLLRTHPAPLPSPPPLDRLKSNPNWKPVPPKPSLKISRVESGIVISWTIEKPLEGRFEDVASYQIFAYQETKQPPSQDLWKKIGDVKALPLPMACTLTQFMAGFKYYFAVRAVDVRQRFGAFSLATAISLM